MMNILIIDPQFDDIPDIEREVAGPDVVFDIVRPGDGEVPAGPLSHTDAVINCRSRHKLPAHLVAHMDRVRVIVQAGVGVNHIDLQACARRGIPVCNTPDYGTLEVADHTIALLLSLTRATTAYNNRILKRDDAWSTLDLPVPPIRRLRDQVFGIIGLGRIGLATASRATAFQMRIIFHDPFLPPGIEQALGYRRASSLQDLLAEANIVSLHCPLTAETANMIDDAAIAAMKPGAILLNTSRGGTADIDAIARGLKSGKLCAAGLDVLAVEPLDRTHPLFAAWIQQEAWLEGRLIVTPHAAFYTPESLVDLRRLSMLTAIQFLKERRMRSCVNLDLLRSFGHEPDSSSQVAVPLRHATR